MITASYSYSITVAREELGSTELVSIFKREKVLPRFFLGSLHFWTKEHSDTQ